MLAAVTRQHFSNNFRHDMLDNNHTDLLKVQSQTYYRGVGAKLEVVRENFSLLASFVITTGASVYYSCQRQLMLGGLGACPPGKFRNFVI